MNTIFDDYLSTLDNSEKKQIISLLKNNDYARLEVLLRRPYTHEVVIPQPREHFLTNFVRKYFFPLPWLSFYQPRR